MDQTFTLEEGEQEWMEGSILIKHAWIAYIFLQIKEISCLYIINIFQIYLTVLVNEIQILVKLLNVQVSVSVFTVNRD